MAKAKKKLNILLVCPLAVGEKRLHDLTWQSIQGLAWDQPLDILLMRDDAPDSPHITNLTAKMNRARSIFLQGNYDAMFVIEADMIIPSIALQRLTRIKADVAYGVYCTRRGAYRWLAYATLEGNGQGEVVKAQWGKPTESKGVGFGCTLIHRRVLEALEFHEGPEGEGADWNLAKDLVAGGYRQVHDFGVLCGHILHNETRLRVIWPIEHAPYYEITEPERQALREMAQNVQAGTYVARKPLILQTTGRRIGVGETVELSAALAADFLQRKIVDVYDSTGEL